MTFSVSPVVFVSLTTQWALVNEDEVAQLSVVIQQQLFAESQTVD